MTRRNGHLTARESPPLPMMALAIIDVAARKEVARIDLPKPNRVPEDLAWSPDTKYVLAGLYGEHLNSSIRAGRHDCRIGHNPTLQGIENHSPRKRLIVRLSRDPAERVA